MIADFEYFSPGTVEEAFSLLSQYKEEAKIIAGGQSVLVIMRQGLFAPEYLIDIKGISALDYIKYDEGKELRIGALTIHRDVEKSPVIQKHFGVLSEMEHNLATVQTRNWGTIGGNLCHGDPAIIWLGVEVNRYGGRHIAVDLSPIVSCHMYNDLGAIWRGLAKSIYSVAAVSKWGLAGLLVAGYAFFLAPFYWLWNELFVVVTPSDWRLIIIFQVGTVLAMRWLVDKHFKESIISTITHPLGFAFLILNVLYAGSRQAVGAGVQWKERLYSKESSIT